MCLSRSSWLPNSLACLLPRARRRFDCRLVEVLLLCSSSCSHAQLPGQFSSSDLLSLPAAGPLFYFFFSVSTPSSARLCFTDCSSRFTSHDVVCSSSSSRACDFDDLFAHPRADPRVLLVVRWLRHQPSRAARGPLGLSPACTLCPTARSAWSRCFLRSRGFVTYPFKLCAAVLMALRESPTMALHGLSVLFCIVVVAFLVTVHVHVAILLWSALAEDLRVDAIVWLSQHVELFVSSILLLGFQGCRSTKACSRHCFGWCLMVSPALSAQSRVF